MTPRFLPGVWVYLNPTWRKELMRKKIQQESYSCSLAFGVAVYCSTSAFLPLSPLFPPSFSQGIKWKNSAVGKPGTCLDLHPWFPAERRLWLRVTGPLGGWEGRWQQEKEMTALQDYLLPWNRCQRRKCWEFQRCRHSWEGKMCLQKGIFTQLWSACVVLNVLKSPWQCSRL